MEQFMWRWSVVGAMMILMPISVCAQGNNPSSGLISNSGVVYSTRNSKIYVVDSEHSSVVILAVSNTPRTVRTGAGPVSIAVNERTGKVYVANSGSRSVTVIDTDTDDVIATIPTAARPYAIAVDESSDKVYVSNTFSNMLTVIDGKTNIATSLKTGSADAILVDAPNHKVYLLAYESDSLTVFDEESGRTSKISAGAMHLWGFVEMGATLYVTHVQDATIAAIDTGTYAIKEIATGSMPCALAVDSDRGEIYVANYATGSISAVNTRTGVMVWTVKVGGHPQAIAIDGPKRLIYVADAQNRSVSLINIEQRRLLKKLGLTGQPYALAVNTKTNRIFAATMGTTPYEELSEPSN